MRENLCSYVVSSFHYVHSHVINIMLHPYTFLAPLFPYPRDLCASCVSASSSHVYSLSRYKLLQRVPILSLLGLTLFSSYNINYINDPMAAIHRCRLPKWDYNIHLHRISKLKTQTLICEDYNGNIYLQEHYIINIKIYIL